MHLGVFYEVILPLLEVEGTALICISTPLDAFNFYSELTELKDDKGRNVFNVRHIKGGTPPAWKSEAARGRIKAMYGTRDAMFRREIMGEIVNDGENMAFNLDKLRQLFEKAPMQSPFPINGSMIYIAIDPNGGASASNNSPSDTAIVSFVVSQGRVVIVGLESYGTSVPEQPRRILYKHIEALKRQPHLKHCRITLIPEANLGDQAQMLSQMALRVYNDKVDILCEKSHCYGVFTKPGDPERYVLRMSDKLNEEGVFFHETLVCANPYLKPADRLEAAKREFKRQLMSFRAIHIVPASITSRMRILYSGKVGAEGKRAAGQKDDLCMAFLFGYFYYTQSIARRPLVGKRSITSMLRIDPQGGTHFEGGHGDHFAQQTMAAAQPSAARPQTRKRK